MNKKPVAKLRILPYDAVCLDEETFAWTWKGLRRRTRTLCEANCIGRRSSTYSIIGAESPKVAT